METAVILTTISGLLLLSFIFDITAYKTKIPTVLILIFLGMVLNQIILFMGINLPDLSPILPILGTLGLILIVLEGSLELIVDKSKIKIIQKTFFMAFISILIISLTTAIFFSLFTGESFRKSLINSIPFAIISSAIAIPSSKILNKENREFIVYESSFSDIIGVMLFYTILLNTNFNFFSVLTFSFDIFLIVIISLIMVIALAFIFTYLNSDVKFTPILLLIAFIYSIGKMFHMPSLLFILILGLVLGNINKIKNIKFVKNLEAFILINYTKLENEVYRFKEVVIEGTFLVKSLFFILLGFSISVSDIINITTLPWAIGILCLTYLIRYLQLKFFNLPVEPLIYVAPRGLITILLFLSIPINEKIPIVNNALVLQVVIFSVLFMAIGLKLFNREENQKES